MRLYTDLKHAMNTIGTLARSMLERVPVLVVSCAFLLIASQLSVMAAFLIPLKILFVADSGKVPDYVVSILGDLSNQELVILLSVIAVGLYLAHLTIDFARSNLEQIIVKKLLPSDRVALVERSPVHIKKAVEHVVRMVSSSVFSLAIAFGLSFLVEGLMSFLALYFAFIFLVYCGYYQRISLEVSELSKWISFHIGIVSAIGFLTGFAFILLAVMAGEMAPVILAVLALILLRLLMNQVSGLFKSGAVLHTNFTVYDHLLSGSTWTKKLTADEELISSLGSGELSVPEIWEASGIERDALEHHWMDSGFKGAALVKVVSSDGCASTVKIYAKNTSSAAEREQRVLQLLGDGNGAPKVLSELSIKGHSVRILDYASEIDADSPNLRQHRFSFLSSLMAIEPSKELIALATAVNKPIHRRVDLVQIVSLLVKSNSLPDDFDDLCSKWPRIQKMLDNSPLQLVVRAAPGTLGLLDNQQVVCNHWENWSIEPVGAVWDGAGLPGSMHDLLNVAKTRRPVLEGLSVEQLQLVHALCRLDVGRSRQRLSSSADAILQIDAFVKALDPMEMAA